MVGDAERPARHTVKENSMSTDSTTRVRKIAGGALALAAAAALATPAVANAAGPLPAGSTGSLQDLAMYLGNDLSAPDVDITTSANQEELTVESTNTMAIVDLAAYKGTTCTTIIASASDVVDGMTPREVSGIQPSLAGPRVDNLDHITDSRTFDSQDFSNGPGEYTAVTVCSKGSSLDGPVIWHGSAATGAYTVFGAVYRNADFTLNDDDTFTITDGPPGNGPTGGLGSTGGNGSLSSLGALAGN